MCKITNNPFLAKCEYIDIHAETSAIARVLVEQFMNDSIKLKRDKVMILHGKGTDVLRKMTHDYIRVHPNVVKYYYDGINNGLTVVELKID